MFTFKDSHQNRHDDDDGDYAHSVSPQRKEIFSLTKPLNFENQSSKLRQSESTGRLHVETAQDRENERPWLSPNKAYARLSLPMLSKSEAMLLKFRKSKTDRKSVDRIKDREFRRFRELTYRDTHITLDGENNLVSPMLNFYPELFKLLKKTSIHGLNIPATVVVGFQMPKAFILRTGSDGVLKGAIIDNVYSIFESQLYHVIVSSADGDAVRNTSSNDKSRVTPTVIFRFPSSIYHNRTHLSPGKAVASEDLIEFMQSGSQVIQRFILGRGTNPSMVRCVWVKGKGPRCYLVSSKKKPKRYPKKESFVRKGILDSLSTTENTPGKHQKTSGTTTTPSTNGNHPTLKLTNNHESKISREAKSPTNFFALIAKGKQTKAKQLFSVNNLEQVKQEGFDQGELKQDFLVDKTSMDRFSFVKSKDGAFPEADRQTKLIVDLLDNHILKTKGLYVEELVLDFVQDINGKMWFLSFKSFKPLPLAHVKKMGTTQAVEFNLLTKQKYHKEERPDVCEGRICDDEESKPVLKGFFFTVQKKVLNVDPDNLDIDVLADTDRDFADLERIRVCSKCYEYYKPIEEKLELAAKRQMQNIRKQERVRLEAYRKNLKRGLSPTKKQSREVVITEESLGTEIDSPPLKRVEVGSKVLIHGSKSSITDTEDRSPSAITNDQGVKRGMTMATSFRNRSGKRHATVVFGVGPSGIIDNPDDPAEFPLHRQQSKDDMSSYVNRSYKRLETKMQLNSQTALNSARNSTPLLLYTSPKSKISNSENSARLKSPPNSRGTIGSLTNGATGGLSTTAATKGKVSESSTLKSSRNNKLEVLSARYERIQKSHQEMTSRQFALDKRRFERKADLLHKKLGDKSYLPNDDTNSSLSSTRTLGTRSLPKFSDPRVRLAMSTQGYVEEKRLPKKISNQSLDRLMGNQRREGVGPHAERGKHSEVVLKRSMTKRKDHSKSPIRGEGRGTLGAKRVPKIYMPASIDKSLELPSKSNSALTTPLKRRKGELGHRKMNSESLMVLTPKTKSVRSIYMNS